MRIHSFKLVALCAALVLSQAGLAQGNSGKNRRNDCGNGNGNCAEQRGNDFSQGNRDERGAGPNHDFHRGGRLPPEYHNRQYVVDDWRAHRLQAPPRGYHWVQTGGDYVLVAIATGVILQLILGGYN